MFSPFEELEYLADYLPDEGETVLVSREAGELVCKPWLKDDLRDGVDDAVLYGKLVQANERLHDVGAFPVWMTLIGMTWLTILVHGIWRLDLSHWYVVPGIGLPLLYGCFQWIRYRQEQCFHRLVWPELKRELIQRRISLYSLISGARQHAELRTLLDELVQLPSEEVS